MVFSRDVLFLHVPKTGGMSVTRFLLSALPGTVYYTALEPQDDDCGAVFLKGIRHETLADAREILSREGLSLDAIPVILAVIRNPYEIEVSRYHYLRKGYRWDRRYDQALALTRDFETFVLRARPHAGVSRQLADYFSLDGERPPNLVMLRCESLAEDLEKALAGVALKSPVILPRETSPTTAMSPSTTPAGPKLPSTTDTSGCSMRVSTIG